MRLVDLADQAQNIKQNAARSKRCRIIKAEMTKLKKKVTSLNASKQFAESHKVPAEEEPEKEDEEEEEDESSHESSSDSESSSSEDRPLIPSSKKKVLKKKKRVNRDTPEAECESKIRKLEEGAEGSCLASESRANVKTEVVTPSKSTINGDTATVSPSGVNRRTAVLFTRKAQAAASAFKKPETPSELM